MSSPFLRFFDRYTDLIEYKSNRCMAKITIYSIEFLLESTSKGHNLDRNRLRSAKPLQSL